jgi:uncharacterized membrane protein
MDNIAITIVLLIIVVLILAAVVLPIVALVIAITTKKKLEAQLTRLDSTSSLSPDTLQQLRTSDLAPLAKAIQQLDARIETIEAALALRTIPFPEVTERDEQRATPQDEQLATPAITEPPSDVKIVDQPDAPQPSVVHPSQPLYASTLSSPQTLASQAADIESIIGRRWVGWIAIGLILFATAFFLKYAFDNRWIGELGRVTIGVAAGLTLTILGFRYHQRRWRIFSQILTAGGIVLLYLSVYAAFGYYHLVTQKAAFAYLLILVAEAAGLAVLYDAQAIAIMALVGGFLTPILLRSDRDQYRSLFGYIAALDAGTLVLPKHWIGLNSLAFIGTHLLFWLWYGDNYHPRKLGVVMTFQTGTFLIFLLAPLGRRLIKRESVTIEDLCLLPINAFVFFATAYHLLNPNYHDWMGVFAIVMALIYAGAAKLLLDRAATTQMETLATIGIALTFVTLAIPIQLKANWITIAWAVQALTMLWVAIETKSTRLHAAAYALFILALGKLVVWDTNLAYRAEFTPVLNKYFLSSLAVTACLFAAAALHQKWDDRQQTLKANLRLAILLIAIGTLWFIMSVETFTYFRAQAFALKEDDGIRHKLWLGQMALSILWSVYAGALAAIGFVRRSAAVRWASLGLFGVTVIKVMLVDIAQLKQLYRIIAFLVLGVLLLIVAWGYHKAFRSRES